MPDAGQDQHRYVLSARLVQPVEIGGGARGGHVGVGFPKDIKQRDAKGLEIRAWIGTLPAKIGLGIARRRRRKEPGVGHVGIRTHLPQRVQRGREGIGPAAPPAISRQARVPRQFS